MDGNSSRFIVGIGASAGGLEALESFFKNTSTNSGCTYIVVQHLSPDYKSLMDELLARVTKLPIHVIEDGMDTSPDNIYLIPPRHNLSIFHSKLFLLPWKSNKVLNFPIDDFMNSLAKDQGKNAIGIVMSGTGSDGSIGIKAIKAGGGMVIVQNPDNAKFDGMPRNAIDTGVADYILNPENMPELLTKYINNPRILNDKDESEQEATLGFDNLEKIALIMRNHSGIDFSYYKENTIMRRIERRIQINNFETLDQYIEFMRQSTNEKDILFREMLIGVTGFFRDKEGYDSLFNDVFPRFDFAKKMLRLWIAGCSTGEEAYSIAILLQEYITNNRIDCNFRVFATDIDQHSLEIAGSGRYPENLVGDIDQDLLEKYFTRNEGIFTINSKIREKVVFASHNLIKDPPFSKLDLISCRNLFIYLKPEVQHDVMLSFYYSLEGRNFLFLGSSETVGNLSNAYEIIDKKWKIYKAKPGYSVKAREKLKRSQISIIPNYNFHNPNTLKPAIKQDQLFKDIVTAILPPSIVVDNDNKIVQVINNMKPFFELGTGNISDDISNMISRQLLPFVNNIIRNLRNSKEEVSFRGLNSFKEFEGNELNITGKTISTATRKLYLLSFIVGDIVSERSGLEEISEPDYSHIQELEERLQSSKENLQATVEELETSNEELQSSNEELIASNEELQSTNEELQSVNEELYTVNNEFQKKIEELTLLNSDFNNLIKNTGVGAIYIDRKNIIRKITPLVTEITNISEDDIGRPIKHFKFMDELQDIENLVNKVSEKLQPVELTVSDESGRYWFTSIKPYRTKHNSIEGVIISLVNISELVLQREEVKKLKGIVNKKKPLNQKEN
ncbi:MAG TPA: chemotaxis protein CheB [Bacteroidales bacterium]|nr:chemotaxis protein CheB [Bacteroidales bacterium]